MLLLKCIETFLFCTVQSRQCRFFHILRNKIGSQVSDQNHFVGILHRQTFFILPDTSPFYQSLYLPVKINPSGTEGRKRNLAGKTDRILLRCYYRLTQGIQAYLEILTPLLRSSQPYHHYIGRIRAEIFAGISNPILFIRNGGDPGSEIEGTIVIFYSSVSLPEKQLYITERHVRTERCRRPDQFFRSDRIPFLQFSVEEDLLKAPEFLLAKRFFLYFILLPGPERYFIQGNGFFRNTPEHHSTQPPIPYGQRFHPFISGFIIPHFHSPVLRKSPLNEQC